MKENKIWGYLRETEIQAQKDGIDKDTGICRTGLDAYLEVIFPEITDWIHSKSVPNLMDENGKKRKFMPDYRSEELKMVIEFDGLPHYIYPDIIYKDYYTQELYENNGYKVVRIPYFIQLTNDVVKTMFGRDVKEKLFNENIPSIGESGRCSPAYLCNEGLTRMAKEFIKYPQQYRVNMEYMKSCKNYALVEWKLLGKRMQKIQENKTEF